MVKKTGKGSLPRETENAKEEMVRDELIIGLEVETLGETGIEIGGTGIRNAIEEIGIEERGGLVVVVEDLVAEIRGEILDHVKGGGGMPVEIETDPQEGIAIEAEGEVVQNQIAVKSSNFINSYLNCSF